MHSYNELTGTIRFIVIRSLSNLLYCTVALDNAKHKTKVWKEVSPNFI